jgi:GT2 family glycosyltransferase
MMSFSRSDESGAANVMTLDVGPAQDKQSWPDVAIVILNYNSPEETIQCVESFETLHYPNSKIVIVDNGSKDDSCRLIRQRFPETSLICTGSNLGYAGGNNKGIEYALCQGADLVLIVNNDTQVLNRDFLRPLVRSVLSDPKAGIAGPKVANPGGYIQKTILYSPTLMNYVRNSRLLQKLFSRHHEYDTEQEVEAVCGVCWLLRAEVFRTVGMLDEEYFMYAEEQDYCYRARKAGWKVIYSPTVSILHERAANDPKSMQRRYVYSRRNLVLFLRKHSGLFQALLIALMMVASDTLRVAACRFRRKHMTEPVFYGAGLLRSLISEIAAVLGRWPQQ